MLVLRHNELSSDQLIICERTMLKFIDDKFSTEETGMNFNVWKWSIPELYGIVLGMFVKLDLVGTLDIRKSEMLDFIIDVEKGYCDTSYHSFLHAVDVVVVLYYMLTDLGAAKYISSLDAICLLIAGLCHDIGHPGLNNVYQVNARTDLAIRYNDQSVLENYSCDLTMDIITKHKLFRHVHKCNTEYVGCDPKEVNTSLKDLIKKTILATDMMFHFDLLESLHNMIESTSCSSFSSEESGEESENSCTSSPASSLSSSPETSPISMTSQKQFPISTSNTTNNTNNTNNGHVKIIRSFSRSSSSSIIVTLDTDQRELLLKVLIHAADLSNTVRPWEISKLWSDRVVEEFFCQGDLEKANNFPVSPNMDREQSHQCQISLGFGDYVVKPYFEAFATFLNPATIFLDILAENRVFWDNMKNAPPIPDIVLPCSQSTSTHPSNESSNIITPTSKEDTVSPSKGQRRVSLAAGLLIIPEDIQEKLRLMTSSRSPRHRRLKRSLSGRSFSHHTLLPTPGSLAPDDDDDQIDYRKSTRRKSDGPNILLNGVNNSNNLPISVITTDLDSYSTEPLEDVDYNTSASSSSSTFSSSTMTACSHHQKRLHGRMRRSSSLDHNMIRQITALYGTGDTPASEHRVVMAGS